MPLPDYFMFNTPRTDLRTATRRVHLINTIGDVKECRMTPGGIVYDNFNESKYLTQAVLYETVSVFFVACDDCISDEDWDSTKSFIATIKHTR